MSDTLTPALIAGSGCSLVNAIYDHSDEDLNDDEAYERAMTAVIHLTYTLTGHTPHGSLITWLVQGEHHAALTELLSANLIPAEQSSEVERALKKHHSFSVPEPI